MEATRVCTPRASQHSSKLVKPMRLRQTTISAAPAHHHVEWAHPAGFGLPHMTSQALEQTSNLAPSSSFGPILEPHPSLFSSSGVANSHRPEVATQAVPAAKEWVHPYPENPKRWKVDEDSWYVPPEGWMQQPSA